jgi:hypothetical protein
MAGGRKDNATRKSSIGCSERKRAAHAAVGSRGHVSTGSVVPSAITPDGLMWNASVPAISAHAPILLSTSSSFCRTPPPFDATRALLRCASGSRASKTSITTSALSSTAARCGRSGLRSGGDAPSTFSPAVEADVDVPPLVAGTQMPSSLDLEELFVGPPSVATLSSLPSRLSSCPVTCHYNHRDRVLRT